WVAVNRLQDKGQLEWRLWEPFTQWAVIRFLLDGLWMTLKLGAASMVLALTIGAFLALGRLARSAPVRWLAGAYVEFFRAVPLLLLILFTVIGLPKYGIGIDDFWLVVMALVAYNSAILGEIFRAGILSLDRGQTEAASAIGLGYWPAMRLVILPQAVRRMVPAVVSQLITLLKDTSLAFVVSFQELLRHGKLNGEFFRNPLQSYFVVALMFIAINFTLSRIARRLEQRQRRVYRATEIQVAGAGEDLAVT
ncbi:MAG: amino acid ABC transporter permease, partial [Acidimicrobiia bacterium]